MNAHAITGLVREALRPLSRRVRMLATLGKVVMADDTQPFQTLQLTALAGERISGAQRVQQWGSRGNPPAGATVIILSIGGSRSLPIVVACEAPGAAPGPLPSGGYEIYDSNGTYLRLNGDGTWNLKATGNGTVDCPQVSFTGNAIVEQNLTVLGTMAVEGIDGTTGLSISTNGKIHSATDIADATGTMATMRTQHNDHAHPDGTPDTGLPTVLMS